MQQPQQAARPTRAQAKYARRVVNATQRAFAPGREERMAKARAKRDRKAAKRARDAEVSAIGQLRASERLEGCAW
jgi:hypothetical protein